MPDFSNSGLFDNSDENFKRKNKDQMYRQFQEQSTANIEDGSASGFPGSTVNHNLDKISNIFSDRNSLSNIHLRNFSRDSCPAGVAHQNLGSVH